MGVGPYCDVSVTEKEPTAPKRWSAFVCPDCRVIFRLPGDSHGEGVTCPSCRRLLRTPREGENPPPLNASLQKIDFVEDDFSYPQGEAGTRRKRKKISMEGERLAWEVNYASMRFSRNKEKLTLRSFAGWILVISVMLGITYFLMISDEPIQSPENVAEKADFQEIAEIPILLNDEQLEEPIEMPKILQRGEHEFIASAQPIAETFLTATTVEQILPLIRDLERVKPQILAYYPDGKIKPTGLSKFNATDAISYLGSHASVVILTPESEYKHLAFVDGADGLKIDWESWVGWSEMPWDKLIESRPTSPMLVRAKLKWMDYYNFGFSDESKWRSYQLLSPNEEQSLFAYAERNSSLDQVLRPAEKSIFIHVTLKIRFPDNGEKRNQVVIVEHVSDGWVVPDKVE